MQNISRIRVDTLLNCLHGSLVGNLARPVPHPKDIRRIVMMATTKDDVPYMVPPLTPCLPHTVTDLGDLIDFGIKLGRGSLRRKGVSNGLCPYFHYWWLYVNEGHELEDAAEQQQGARGPACSSVQARNFPWWNAC